MVLVISYCLITADDKNYPQELTTTFLKLLETTGTRYLRPSLQINQGTSTKPAPLHYRGGACCRQHH